MSDTKRQKPLNTKEAAEFLGISRSHLYRLTSRGEIAHYKPNGIKLYFLEEDLLAYLKSGKVRASYEVEAETA
jgi:excisionase family DNA binding protein